MAMAMISLEKARTILLKITIFIKDVSSCLITTMGLPSSTARSLMAPSATRSTTPLFKL
jgi:hypothetical protein